jgi:ribosomal protein S18 acetylase RimI-like enzyme
MTALAPVVAFRPITDEDRTFLVNLYISTRAGEFRHMAWSDAQVREFLTRQFDFQKQSYEVTFLGAAFRIIQLEGVDVGRLYVDRGNTYLHIIEFSLVPEWRGRGLGTNILRSLLNEAHGGKVPVRLSVLKDSPAVSLYLRHGFRIIGDKGSHHAMEWMPDTGPRVI